MTKPRFRRPRFTFLLVRLSSQKVTERKSLRVRNRSKSPEYTGFRQARASGSPSAGRAYVLVLNHILSVEGVGQY